MAITSNVMGLADVAKVITPPFAPVPFVVANPLLVEGSATCQRTFPRPVVQVSPLLTVTVANTARTLPRTCSCRLVTVAAAIVGMPFQRLNSLTVIDPGEVGGPSPGGGVAYGISGSCRSTLATLAVTVVEL